MRLAALLLIVLPALAVGEEALVATAANFRTVLEGLRAEFESATPHTLRVVSGSTGKLYAQVLNGAPFDLFLAADQERPKRLESSPFGVPGSRLTYALGRLAIVAAEDGSIRDDAFATLSANAAGKLAIANPASAPYGLAADQALAALGLRSAYAGRLVFGENVAQVLTMVRTGNAAIGIVAQSLAMESASAGGGPYETIPANLHDPIRQDAILLAHGKSNAAASAFLDFIESPAARALIAAHGYEVE